MTRPDTARPTRDPVLAARRLVAAAAALALILNSHLATHLATSSFSSAAFLRDGTGPPMMAALLALALAGSRLPFSLPLFDRPRASTP
jgi:hypothetical protein